MRRVLDYYKGRQKKLPEFIEQLEADGCPHTAQSFTKWQMLTEYSIPPFEGVPDTWPVWFDDDMTYFSLKQEYATLPYRIRDVEKWISNAT